MEERIMKTNIKLCGAIILSIFITAEAFAQNPASATWPLTNPASSGTGRLVNVSGNIAADSEYFRNMEINGYTGLNNSQRVRMAGTVNTWPASQTTQMDTVYTQFSVSAKTGNTFKIDSLTLYIGSASTNFMKANLYYSKDSTFATKTAITYATGNASNYLISAGLTYVSVGPNMTLNQGETFYFRFYPWLDNQTSGLSGKYVCIQSVVVTGSTQGIPTPASASWPLFESQTAATSGLVVAQDQSFSNLGHYSYVYLGPGTGNPNCDRIITLPINSGTWPAEVSPNFTRYIQYDVSPKPGGTFFVNSVSVSLGAQFTNNLKAAIYYSHDTSFATSTLVMADTALDATQLVPKSYGITDTIADSKTFYLRIYPHDAAAEGFAKLICIANVVIAGNTTGASASLATVKTTTASFISTTFATSGGNISADGGAPVTARGVCWDTANVPTTAKSTTLNGTGTGSFVSQVTGLTPDKKYYLRAYAINTAGTAYGSLDSITTLAVLAVPTVTTSGATSILTTTANVVGNVTAWGGDSVKARGVCWNTVGSPTTANSKTDNGSGIGSFTGTLTGLTPTVTYHVRAFALNSIGTGYGNEVTFTTQTPASDIMKVVSKDGKGNYTTVQAAFDSVPDNYTGKYFIYVRKGTYKEKLLLSANKLNVVLAGESRDSTILTYDDYAGKPGLGTSTSYSVAIDASDFVAMNITFQNTVKNDGSVANQQAVALRVNGDRQAYYNCNLLGYQDTYYTWGGSSTGRTYHKNCYITGSVDFIFGRNIVVFDSCTINENRNGGTLTAASTEATTKFGYVFLNTKITYDSIGFDGVAITNFYLGRPWQASPRTVFIRCVEPAKLNPAGWLAWNVPPGLYGEYKCSGPGFTPASRDTSLSRAINDSVAGTYTLANIFSKNSVNPAFGFDWMPVKPVVNPPTSVGEEKKKEVPVGFNLLENFPNPFNPTTLIRFSVAKEGLVKLKVFNLLGQEVAILYSGNVASGKIYSVEFNAASFSSGVFFSVLESDGQRQVKKMVLMK